MPFIYTPPAFAKGSGPPCKPLENWLVLSCYGIWDPFFQTVTTISAIGHISLRTWQRTRSRSGYVGIVGVHIACLPSLALAQLRAFPATQHLARLSDLAPLALARVLAETLDIDDADRRINVHGVN